jgi:hypothetical protein
MVKCARASVERIIELQLGLSILIVPAQQYRPSNDCAYRALIFIGQSV